MAAGNVTDQTAIPAILPTDTLYVVRSAADRKTTGAGAVPDIFNVKAYGALGDGTTDDAANVQSAVTACAAAGGGDVYFPKGSYRIGTTITNATSNVRVRGCGEGSILLHNITAGDLFSWQPSSPPANSDGAGLEGIVFSDLYIEGYSTTQHSAGRAIYATYTKGMRIERVRFGTQQATSGAGTSGNLLLWEAIGLAFQSACWIQDCRIFAIRKGITLTGLGFSSGTLGPSGFPYYGYDGVIRGNIIYNKWLSSSVGVHLAGGTGGVMIDGTDIGGWETGLLIDKTGQAEINREVFLGVGCFLDSSGIHGCNIAASSLQKFHATDFWSAGGGHMSTGHGLNMNGTQDSDFRGIIHGGRVYANSGDGLNLAAGRWTVTGLDVHTNTGAGINMSGGSSLGDCTIVGNKVTGNTGTGMLTSTGQNNYVIVGNTIRSNTAAQLTDTAAGANKVVANNLTA